MNPMIRTMDLLIIIIITVRQDRTIRHHMIRHRMIRHHRMIYRLQEIHADRLHCKLRLMIILFIQPK